MDPGEARTRAGRVFAGPIELAHLPEDISGRGMAHDEGYLKGRPLADSMRAFERQCLILALNATDGVKFKAAQILGISRKTLWEKLKFHNITSAELDDDDQVESERVQHAGLG